MKSLIKDGLCTGCGICISESKSKKMRMSFNKYGFLEPINIQDEDNVPAIKVCPFNPNPENFVKDEDVLAKEFFPESIHKDPQIGRFENTYIGYSYEFRNTSSSGGIATFIFKKLLQLKKIDYLFIVTEKDGRYQYQLFDQINNINKISKTKYYPVTMSSLFSELDKIKGSVAVSGVGCFIKAIRLKQMYYPEYKDKIPFLIGLICGGIKSSYFADYLAASAGVTGEYRTPEFRVKNINSKANDYAFECIACDSGKSFKIKMKSVGDMWGTGFFKSNACDFCTDVTTELADISIGDAWLDEYVNDGAGNSVVITRNKFIDEIILTAILEDELHISKVSKEKIIQSQRGSFTHRQDAIKFRSIIASVDRKPFFRKRYKSFISPVQMSVQICRRLTRARSLILWHQYTDIKKFNSKMKKYRILLRIITKLDHVLKKLTRKLNLNEK